MVETHALKDKIFVIEPCNAALKSRLEGIVVKNGGKIEQNAITGRTHAYVETGFKIRAKSVADKGACDVVRSSWLLDCDENGFRPLRPADVIVAATPETVNAFERDFDRFGDSFTTPVTNRNELKYSMGKVAEMEEEYSIGHAEISDFEAEHFLEPFKFSLFRRCVVFCPRNVDVAASSLRFYGAKIVDSLEPGVTHAIVDEKAAEEEIVALRNERRKRREKFHIVTEDWVDRCLEENQILEGRNFEPE